MQDATMVAAPERSLQQRMDALGHANVVRIYRARLKRDMKAGVGGRYAVDVLAEPTELESSWKVYDVLLAMPRVGQVKVNKILMRNQISPSKTVGGLTERQRSQLVRALWAMPAAHAPAPERRAA